VRIFSRSTVSDCKPIIRQDGEKRVVQMADEITLSDKYVLLLQNSIQETSAFRKEIATKEKSQDSRINQLIEKLEEIGDKIEGASSKGKAKKISRTEQSIPKRCRVSSITVNDWFVFERQFVSVCSIHS